MEIKQYQAAIEAVLFAAGEPLAVSRLAETLELDEETVVRLTEDLKQEINTRGGGLMMVRLEDQYQLCTRQEYAGYVRKALDIRRNTPLSQAAMEVLAIVAYNQPVTKAFIEQVRGVDCGAVVQGLVTKTWWRKRDGWNCRGGRCSMGRRRISCGVLGYPLYRNFLRCLSRRTRKPAWWRPPLTR